MFGAGVDPGRRGPDHPLHLVDLSRAVADTLELTSDRRSPGRPLAAALAAPASTGATLPRSRLSVGLAVAVAGAFVLALGLVLLRRHSWAVLVWMPLAYAGVLLFEAIPTMSNPMVYRPLGRAVYTAGLPGLAVLAVGATLALRHHRAWRVAVAVLSPAVVAVAVTRIAVWRQPPLVPSWTAHCSAAHTLLFAGAIVVGLALLARALPIATSQPHMHDDLPGDEKVGAAQSDRD